MKIVNNGIIILACAYAFFLISYGLVKISGDFIYVPDDGAVICELI